MPIMDAVNIHESQHYVAHTRGQTGREKGEGGGGNEICKKKKKKRERKREQAITIELYVCSSESTGHRKEYNYERHQ